MSETIYRIYFNSAAGLDYTGTWAYSEKEAKEMCRRFDGDKHNPYGSHVYRLYSEKKTK